MAQSSLEVVTPLLTQIGSLKIGTPQLTCAESVRSFAFGKVYVSNLASAADWCRIVVRALEPLKAAAILTTGRNHTRMGRGKHHTAVVAAGQRSRAARKILNFPSSSRSLPRDLGPERQERQRALTRYN